ncbi:MAG: GIY-YIG nuclease family protein [Solirubrobacteraceae bacterium]
MTEPAQAHVYLLRCRDGSLYCGWTVDVEKRLAAHATGKASRYTSRRLPVALAAAWEMETASAARRMEWRIKQLSRTQKLALIGGAELPALEPA